MTTRETSRKAWREMVDSGELLGKQAAALAAVIDYGPGTSGEIIRAAKLGANTNLWRARFTELIERGLIREIGQRSCDVTGRTGLVFEFTGRTKPLTLDRGRGRKVTDAQRRRVRDAIGQNICDGQAIDVDAVIRAVHGQ